MQFLMGIVFLLLGFFQYKFPPKKINDLYGYRTKNSMSSIEKWNLAQKHSSILMMKIAIFHIICSFTGSLYAQSENSQLAIGIVVALSSCAVLFYFTEKKLKTESPKNLISEI